MRAAEEMDQADFELRQTIIKVWPYEGKEKIDLLVPPREGRVATLRFAAKLACTVGQEKYFSAVSFFKKQNTK